MTDTLTACARAMEQAACDWADQHAGEFISEECPYDILARACLQAAADNVSEEMVQAGDDADYLIEPGDGAAPGACKIIFTAMVRAAIGERG